MELIDLNWFFWLSSSLRLQLDLGKEGSENLADIILDEIVIKGEERQVLLDVIDFVKQAYGSRRRRLGTPSVLHPLRTAALLARTVHKPELIELLAAILHDKFEDIIEKEFTDKAEFQRLETIFTALVKRIEPTAEWYLMERLSWLTRQPGETYNLYIGKLLRLTQQTPELMRVKLADRLDNTLDLRIAVTDPMQGLDFFEMLFQVLFVNGYQGYLPDTRHPAGSSINGATRLYQLYKTAVVLSLVRQTEVLRRDRATKLLFDTLARASMREAQRIALHIFGYHMRDVREQRSILMDTMHYVQEGGIEQATLPTQKARLDGLFLQLFECIDPVKRKQTLKTLYDDKSQMVAAAVAFIVIFSNFLADPNFYVHAVTDQGIMPEMPK